MTKIKPLTGYCVIKPITEDEPKGIIILLKKQGVTSKGKVIAVGKPPPGVPVQMKPDDIVIFPAGEGIPVTEKNENILIMKQHVILFNETS